NYHRHNVKGFPGYYSALVNYPTWIDGAYDEGAIIRHDSAVWVAAAAITAGQEPGVHASWESSIAAGASGFATVTVAGAKLGDYATAALSVSPGRLMIGAEVTADDTAIVTHFNPTGAPIALPAFATTMRVQVES